MTTTAARAWSGRGVTKARQHMAALLPMPCGKCGQVVTLEQRWVIGHRIPRAIRPDLMWEPTNWQPEHRKCSDGTGVGVLLERHQRERLREMGARFSGAGVTGYSPCRGCGLQAGL